MPTIFNSLDILLYSNSFPSIIETVSVAFDLVLEKINSSFFKYVISSVYIIVSLSLSLITTLPSAYNIFKILSYLKLSAVIRILFSDEAVPLFFPIKVFPLSNISISVISKLNTS